MNTAFARLLPLFHRERDAGRTLVLATIVRTAGSTYRKTGAQMLIAADGEYAGLLSGGCLEGDLREHAKKVAASGESQWVSYDMRAQDDLIFGIGAGCEGAMDIFLQRVSAANQWQPLAALAENWRSHRADSVAIVVRSADQGLPAGTVVTATGAHFTPQGGQLERNGALERLASLAAKHAGARGTVLIEQACGDCDALLTDPQLPPRLLILGGGPDAQPVIELAQFLAWKTTIYDHRPAYAQAQRFPAAERIILDRPEALASAVYLNEYQACVVMSHHLASDLAYLQAIAASAIPYVGLLGPPARRERLLKDLGAGRSALGSRLHAPVGLDIGANTPESIALAIVGEIYAALNGHRPPFAFRGT